MDIGYDPHAERARRKNRSSTNLNHLTLAPLTVKLPLNDDEAIADFTSPARSTSYLQGKSAPTTPRLLSRSPGPHPRRHHRTPSAPGVPIAKSKSSSHLASANVRNSVAGVVTPRRKKDDGLGSTERRDSDWLFRAGAMMSSEAREYKGQAWLVSRQSSTSLAGMRDPEEEAFEAELARERDMASRLASRRGSSALADDDSSPHESRFNSRNQSRSQSRAGIRSLMSPMERQADDTYFSHQEEALSGPDFVNLDEKLEELERDTLQDDEAAIRRLVRKGNVAPGTWIESLMGWKLFSVEESPDSDEDEDDVPTSAVSSTGRSGWSNRHFEGVSNVPEDPIPLPNKDEGGWQDAAWLLSVASKVMF
ncbi:hypothetical protein B0I35DRAFT_481605 [Stachybotrys elegans]|uniref:Uncharacterized protein n=1 Tax=Stachybotrys elegans TaxID=80388 RepID=A0A8K0SLS0_9HYPO|nr:hypothetical protein B0I35DRAFT_481605 [Stachybotrys elegans]